VTDGLSEAYEGKQWDVFCENNDLLLENDELKAENAKLREEVKVVGTVAYVHGMKQLESENAKLRELLQDLAICASGKYCYGCPHQYDGCNRDERLRELGIEVDG
jgi:hypothetical protein